MLYRDRYDELSSHVAAGLQINTALSEYLPENLLDCDAFINIDQMIVKWILERLIVEDTGAKLDRFDIPEVCDNDPLLLGKIDEPFARIAFRQIKHVGRIMQHDSRSGAGMQLVQQPFSRCQINPAFPKFTV